jgi:hypothetical protein
MCQQWAGGWSCFNAGYKSADAGHALCWELVAGYSGAAWLGTVDLHFQVSSVGDYSGDGKVDILWRYANNSNCALGVMNGPQYKGYLPMPSTAELSWKIVGEP